VRGEGNHTSPSWMTIAQALSEIETIDGEVFDAFKKSYRELR
jgi:hypothetical protein